MTATKKEREQQKRERVGEVGYNKNGERMIIIEYINSANIIIQFEDKSTVKTAYKCFKNGNVRKPENRLGEVNYNKNGYKMTIIEYNSAIDITVEFENGFKVFKARYEHFKEGSIKNPIEKGENRIGEIRYNNDGDKMTLVEYINNKNITVQFENGYKAFKIGYENFRRGAVLNPIRKEEGRLGEVNYNFYGSKMTIIEYNNIRDITVQFEDGHIVKNIEYKHFKEGVVKNPYDKSVFGIGYLGEGKHKATINRKLTKKYSAWRSMLERCYDSKYQEKYPTYKGCIVCKEWLNFQNFGDFFNENYYEIEGTERMELDKDILVKHNKVYSPKTACFVPQSINILFVKNDANRGNLPIGVSFHKDSSKYSASCMNANNKKIHIGLYDRAEDAFYLGYKPFKEKIIQKVANKYKSQIPKHLYQSMILYQVEITD